MADEILVGGVWRRGSGAVVESLSPLNGSVIARVHGADPADVDEAVRAGAAVAADPSWRDLLPHERARHLTRIADSIAASAEDLAALQTCDTGKSINETRALVASAQGTFRYFASVLETMDETLTVPRGPYVTMSVHEPIGVVGAITPWNSPIASDAQKIAPALAAGNAVVLKPAEWTPLVSLALARVITDSGLPSGLLSVLPGPGGVTGDAIVRHPGIGKVSFTGGTATGRAIGAVAAQKIMPVSLELGGKSPTIVFPDADLDQTLAGLLFGIFSSSGQSCIAGSRVFIHGSVYEQFLDELVERTRKLRIGPGADPATQVAPLVSHVHRDRVAAMVDRARGEGARVLCGGGVPEGEEYETGAYYLPTILDRLPNDSATCQEEIFGPVLVALPFEDEDDLVAQANDSVYGLACGIWTRDYRRAWRIARRMDAGTVWINTYKQFSISTPFGGMKESGIGREKGREGIAAYMRQKSIYWGMTEEPHSWAG
ncbi:aldehyde dehydrogenase [Actinomadura sp. WAC 06369]|uniref:aldehyde dehydrogenase n=1 Tax=Actinomadura sp. WAC 06369 TaxID=2203193 RepID=UPI000F7A7BE4|nr:aldehyde dehydrogenase [Actinomadura sp. WAC 06369]RSN66640.1 aldehyde dehydrogenase [Actinomadura sp. WAC 06369]